MCILISVLFPLHRSPRTPFAVQQKSRSGRKKFAILIKHRRIHDIPSHFFECDASVPLDFPPLYGNPIRYAEYAQIAITSVFRFFFCDFNMYIRCPEILVGNIPEEWSPEPKRAHRCHPPFDPPTVRLNSIQKTGGTL